MLTVSCGIGLLYLSITDSEKRLCIGSKNLPIEWVVVHFKLSGNNTWSIKTMTPLRVPREDWITLASFNVS